MADRERLIHIVRRIPDGIYADDAELERLVAEFESSVSYPGASDLVF